MRYNNIKNITYNKIIQILEFSKMHNNILITGGLGFIGSNFIRFLSKKKGVGKIINIDNKSYSANLNNLKDLNKKKYHYHKFSIQEKSKVLKVINKYNINVIFNFAAESHVDRSIADPTMFIDTNIFGSFQLFQALREHSIQNKKKIKFIHISTDEVYGSLKRFSKSFKENSPFMPNSPYAASKASSDLLARSFFKTYNLPIIITHCSNNYGPFQYPEKLIPLVIHKCLIKKPIPVYGTGKNIRDWIHVEDHCDALYKIMRKGKIGETYNIGSGTEISNIDMVHKICDLMMNYNLHSGYDLKRLVHYVKDRPGHDLRYSVNFSKLKKQLNWCPKIKFDKGIKQTTDWYVKNEYIFRISKSKKYSSWIKRNYKHR